MRKLGNVFIVAALLATALWVPASPSMGQAGTDGLQACRELAFSTEEDFVTQGPEPPDGNPIISDGDLLGPGCAICARNRELLQAFDVTADLGLDAVDVIDVQQYLVAFSTELDSSNRGQFTAGDLLVTNGAILPNLALLYKFDIRRSDLGLDAVHFIGDLSQIIRFLKYASSMSRDRWLQAPDMLAAMLEQYEIDIWFSTEGTAPQPEAPLFLDGDLLSVRYGTIIASNDILLPPTVPAGIPNRGVDFGLDAATADRSGRREGIHFSTEILFEGQPAFTDGDVLLLGNGVVRTNRDLVLPCEPRAEFLGLDALFMTVGQMQQQSQFPHFQSSETRSPNGAGAGEVEYAQQPPPDRCAGLVFSTEEDFVTQGPVPPDGNPIISDGDLLGPGCVICARNRDLLLEFNVALDLGLDAADMIDAQTGLVAFSTELDSPRLGQFTAGDLLATNGAIIPNIALTSLFQVGYDIGLDAVHFIGAADGIAPFLGRAKERGRDYWLQNPGALASMLRDFNIDLWFSTEGTEARPGRPGFLDGDLLSAATGTIVASNDILLPASVPAGIPDRGVDFGLDAVSGDRSDRREGLHFSTEILFQGQPAFTDGDVLLLGNGVVHTNADLVQPCEPRANFLGLDALSIGSPVCEPSIDVDKKVLDPSGAWVDQIEMHPSGRVKFRCVIRNDGTCCALHDLVITDILGDQLDYADNATVDGVPHEPDVITGTELTWHISGPLETGESILIEFEAHVIGCGPSVNLQRATAVCVDTGETVSAEDRATVVGAGGPDLVITDIRCDRANNRIGYEVTNVGCEVAPLCHYTGLWVEGAQVDLDHVEVDLPHGASYEGWFNDYRWPECQSPDLEICADIRNAVAEINEDNNCDPAGCMSGELEWTWNHTRVEPDYDQVMMAPVVADLDGNGVPDVIFTTFKGNNYQSDGILRAIRGSDGSELFSVTSPNYRVEPGGDPAVADIDNDGRPEILANKDPSGVICFEHDGTFKWMSATPSVGGGGLAVADLDGDGRPEIIAGRTVLNNDGTIRWTGTGASSSHPAVANLDMTGHPEVVCGGTAYHYDGSIYWTGGPGGRPAIANFDQDLYPEIVVVGGDQVSMLEHDGVLKWGPVPMPGTGNGPAVIADMDGDGQPEIGVGGHDYYVVFEGDGSIKWMAEIRDHSSRAASSSAFDFDEDGAFEIIYSDELHHRIFRGTDGAVLFQTPGPSGTLTEHPVIVDVDDDGHVEIVAAVNNYAFPGNTGIEVYGNDRCWPGARPIWNQHTYHITNIGDDAAVPPVEANNWEMHNNYRTQAPPAPVERKPDLIVESITGPASARVGEQLDAHITLIIKNIGSAAAVATGGYFHTDLVLSSNNVIGDADDILLIGGRDQVFDVLAPGQSLQVALAGTNTIPGGTAPGSYCLGAIVDSVGNRVDESNEGNNTNCYRIAVQEGPDLEITEIICDRANDRIGYVVTNIGDAPASAGHDTMLWVDGTLICSDEVAVNLAPSASYTGWFDCYTWPSQPCTTISVRVCADHYGEVDESDETNNCAQQRCTCNRVYFEPQDSSTSYCHRTEVQIRVNAVDFKTGQIKLVYNPACADVVNWVPNTTDFPISSSQPGTPGEEWFTFGALSSLTGDYLIGTLTIHCTSQTECTTALDFVEDGPSPSKLFDEWGTEIPASWDDGTFACARGMCGDVAPYPGCNNVIDMGDVALLHSYVGHPGTYSLCCEWCGDVAPVPQCNNVIDMGDVALLHSYVGHPGQYSLCCETASSQIAAPAVVSTQNEVVFVPENSSAPYCNNTEVEIRINATNFKAGQIKMAYGPDCADIVDWVPNTTDFPLSTSDPGTPGEEWFTFSAMTPLTGNYLIGTLTIHCLSQTECSTALDFVEDGPTACRLFDDWGSEIAATWRDGTFGCGVSGEYTLYLPIIMKNAQ